MPSPTYVPVIRNGVDVSFADVTVTGNLSVTGTSAFTGAATFTGAAALNAGGTFGNTLAGTGAAATTVMVSGIVTGDGFDRFRQLADGTLQWGPGNATRDTNLYRSAANTLQTDDSFSVVAAASTTDAIQVRVTGDAQPQCVINGNGRLEFGGGTDPVDVALFRDGSQRLHTINTFVSEGDVVCDVAGGGLVIREGANATSGAATMAAGTVTVNTTQVTASSRIQLTVQSLGTVTAPKAVAVTARVAATSFTITSEDNTDTSVVAWQIIEPAA